MNFCLNYIFFLIDGKSFWLIILLKRVGFLLPTKNWILYLPSCVFGIFDNYVLLSSCVITWCDVMGTLYTMWCNEQLTFEDKVAMWVWERAFSDLQIPSCWVLSRWKQKKVKSLSFYIQKQIQSKDSILVIIYKCSYTPKTSPLKTITCSVMHLL